MSELRHEYSEDDALFNHGILGMRWDGLRHEDELKHYGVKGMRWGVRKDGKPQGFQYGDGKKQSRISKSRTTTTTSSNAVPTGGGGAANLDDDDDKPLDEVFDGMTDAQKAYLNQMIELNGGKWTESDIRRAAKMTFTKEQEAGLTRQSVGEKAGSAVRGAIDRINKFGESSGLTDKLQSTREAVGGVVSGITDKIKDNQRSTTTRTTSSGMTERTVSVTRDGHGRIVSASQGSRTKTPDYIVTPDGRVIDNRKKKK